MYDLNDNFINTIFTKPFNWDKDSYIFNRPEKDMKPYSYFNKENSIIITHNILGINKEDLKISKKYEDKTNYIIIEGKTTDEITGKVYSINSKFAVDSDQLDLNNKKIKSSVKNGLLYIEIPFKANKEKEEDFIITII